MAVKDINKMTNEELKQLYLHDQEVMFQLNLNHNDLGIPISKEEEKLANKIRRRFSLK